MSPDKNSAAMSRRRFLQLAAGGVSIPAIAGLTGCGGGGAGALGGGGGAGGEVTELIVPTNQSPWLDAYRTVAAQYEAESGVRITLREFPYDGLRTQMTNAIQNQNLVFDLFQLDEPWTHQFYDNDWVAPLDEVDAQFSLDPAVLTYAALPFWDPQARTSDPSGRVMGLPINGNVHLLIYRRDLYEQLGLPVPRTWEDAVAAGEQAQQAGLARYGYATRGQASSGGQSITYDYMPVFYSYGATWFVDEGSDWTPAVDTPEALAGTEMYRRLLALGPAEPQTVGQAEVIAALQSGEALQAHVVAAAAAQLEDPSASNVVGKLGYAVVPAGPTGEPAPTSGTWSLCVPRGLPPERAQASYRFIRWMLDKQQQTAFGEAGGIATREDVLGELGGGDAVYLQAVADSMPDVHSAVRYVFSAPMLEVTERILSAIGAGATPAPDGLAQLQEELTRVVREAGFLQ
ncbi:extracellular solute-binding protein [Pseudonocardia nigra]|uniref:extracellular solute-binding protein n=1 Tax=Pseudonocardia nigra TaxID=1921578 RepID=UPI001C5FD6E3|nr:extracellular solute-binding protein [Pseudonocardia nigra]